MSGFSFTFHLSMSSVSHGFSCLWVEGMVAVPEEEELLVKGVLGRSEDLAGIGSIGQGA